MNEIRLNGAKIGGVIAYDRMGEILRSVHLTGSLPKDIKRMELLQALENDLDIVEGRLVLTEYGMDGLKEFVAAEDKKAAELGKLPRIEIPEWAKETMRVLTGDPTI